MPEVVKNKEAFLASSRFGRSTLPVVEICRIAHKIIVATEKERQK